MYACTYVGRHRGIRGGVERHLCADIVQLESGPEHRVPSGVPLTASSAQRLHLCAKHAHSGCVLVGGDVGTLISRLEGWG